MQALNVFVVAQLDAETMLRLQEQIVVTLQENFPFDEYGILGFRYERPDRAAHPLPAHADYED